MGSAPRHACRRRRRRSPLPPPLAPCLRPQAEEVGPCSEKAGPCLVHFKGSRLTAPQLNAWIHGGVAATSIVRAFWLGSNPQVAASQEELLQQLLAAGPPAGGAPLRLQCFPRSLEAWLGDQLLGWNLQPVNPLWVLHIVTLPEQPQQPQRFLHSLQPAAELYNYSAVRGKRVPDQLSKAAGKLAEALVATGLQLTTGVAVDLGAAPGKRWLAAGCGCVVPLPL